MSGLDGYSPFQVGFAQWANYIELGLGVERGFMKMWKHGRLEIWGGDSDPNGDPSITFIPEDAELLRELANELESRAEEYAEYLRGQGAMTVSNSQQPSSTVGAHTEESEEGDEAPEAPEPPRTRKPANGSAAIGKPVIVAGPGATPALNAFALK